MNSKSPDLIRLSRAGMYCDAGSFHIDPVQTVRAAVITHAHADHAMRGSASYYTALPGAELLRKRVGHNVKLFAYPYGQPFTLGKTQITFFPAGHILGSAQIRIEHDERTWCVTGDYKLTPDPTCAAWQPVACDTLITEATFGHPDFVWPDEASVFQEIHQWWRERAAHGKPSVILAYALGKAQRLMARLDTSIAPIQIPAAIEELNQIYRQGGIRIPKTEALHPSEAIVNFHGQGMHSTDIARSQAGALLIMPPGWRADILSNPLLHGGVAIASGWSLRSKTDNIRTHDRAFVLSDHADWPQLNRAIRESGAKRVLITHGTAETLAAHLNREGIQAGVPTSVGCSA